MRLLRQRSESPRSFHAVFLLALLTFTGSAATTASDHESLRFGFAKRTITPVLGRTPVYMAGFGNDRRATGVHDDLWARAVAVSDGPARVVLVSVDLIGLFLDDVEKARAALGERVGEATLVVSSTHNHEGPDTMGLWGPGRFTSGVNPEYLARVRRAIVEVAADALDRLEPSRLLIATTRTPDLIVDNRLPEVIDDEMVVLQAVTDDGRTLGTVVSWGNHPEALGGENTLITADFPHYLNRRLEESLGGTAVFLVGSIGGLMTPLGLELRDATGHPIPGDSFALARAVGERAAAAAIEALETSGRLSHSGAVEYRSARVFVPLENRLFRLATLMGVLDRTVYSEGEPATTLFGDDLQTEIGVLRMGDVEMLLVPGEIYPELVVGAIQDPQDPAADFPGAPPEPALEEMLTSEYRLVVGLANDEIGYILPRSQWDTEAPFAYGREEAQYGEINSVGPSAAPILAEAFAELLER
jgi:hypothetical protein